MPLKTALSKLEDAWEFISQNTPDNVRAVAEMMHKTDVALFKVADFVDNLSPNASATSADVKADFGVTSEKLSEIKSDLEHLKEEMSANKEDESVQAAALNPALKALLIQLLNKAIEELLDRIG